MFNNYFILFRLFPFSFLLVLSADVILDAAASASNQDMNFQFYKKTPVIIKQILQHPGL